MSLRAWEPAATPPSRARGAARRRTTTGPGSPAPVPPGVRSGHGATRKAPAKPAAASSTRAHASNRPTRSSRHGETPRARGERTRERVAEALVSLVKQGEVPPTAKAVAASAGVSVRLVFHHFEDMEALYRRVVSLQFERHWLPMPEVPADLPLDVRIERTVQSRAKLFAEIGDVRRAASAVALWRPEIAEGLRLTDDFSRGWLESTFAPELAHAGRNRHELLAAIDVAASWESWDRMRRTGGLSAAAARRSMALTLHGLLGA